MNEHATPPRRASWGFLVGPELHLGDEYDVGVAPFAAVGFPPSALRLD
jgi:hypothetical protein